MQALKLSTASQVLVIGPLMTTAGAAATGLTIANTEVKLHKRGATTLADKNSGGLTEISDGYYYGTFDATDSNTQGNLRIGIIDAGCMPYAMDVQVKSANQYEAEDTGTEWLSVAATQPVFSNSGGTHTVKKTDGTTTQYTRTLTTDGAALPITATS